MSINWRSFFKWHSNCSVPTYTYTERLSSYVRDTTAFTIEELYQSFKARLLEEEGKQDE